MFGDDVWEAAYSQHGTKSNCWLRCEQSVVPEVDMDITLCPLESPLSNKDKKGKAVPYHLHLWVCAEAFLCLLAHFNTVIKGLSIYLEQGLEVEQAMWLLLNKVT